MARRRPASLPGEVQRIDLPRGLPGSAPVSGVLHVLGGVRGGREGLGFGFPEPRPSGPPSAAQRRTIGVVERRTIEGLRPRRWHADGLPRHVHSRTGRRLPEVAPLDVFRNAMMYVSESELKNVKDGTPGGGHIPAGSGAAPARSVWREVRGSGCGHGRDRLFDFVNRDAHSRGRGRMVRM